MSQPSADHNIIAAFLEAARHNPDAVALVQDGESIAYRNLEAAVIATAARLRSRGIAPGDRVLIFVPMSLALYRVVLALFYMGACPVFLDEWVSIDRLKACLEVAPCKALIAKPGFLLLSFFVGPTRRIPIRIAIRNQTDRPGPEPPTSAPKRIPTGAAVQPEDTALVTFTTGSTGTPKAADRTHAYLYAQLAALQPLLNGVASPCLTLLPIVVLLNLAGGKATILPPKGFKAARPHTYRLLAETVASTAPLALIASPAVVSSLIEAAPGRADLSRLVSVVTGGGPVYPHLAQRMVAAFPKAEITTVYGSTEAEPMAHIHAQDVAAATLDLLLTKGLPVGRPDVAAEVAILDASAQSRDLQGQDSLEPWLMPPGTQGEIVVAGAHVLRHYINNAGAEQETKLRVGGKLWHRTGDCGVLDPDGQLYLRGRCKEVVFRNQQRHDPAMVAYALRAMAGVADSFLLTVDGAAVLALPASEQQHSNAIDEALKTLGLDGVPIRYVDTIPKDPRHQTKVDVEQLRQKLAR